MSIGQNIKRIRESHGMTQAELGLIAGVSDKAVSTWEADMKIPRMGAIQKIADYLHITKSAIIEDDESSLNARVPQGFEPLPETVKIPLVGSIACGDPITAEENVEDYVDAPAEKHPDFALRCKGDSMVDAGISDGDIVYIKIQPQVENGQIAAVRIGEEATLKRVYWDGDTLTLVPANTQYAPKTYRGEDLEGIHIEGKAVGFTHWFE